MEFMTSETAAVPAIPPGVTSIDEVKNLKRTNRTLSKAVSLHLEGKLESAAKLLSKAIDSGESEPALYSALGHIQYEMRDYTAAAADVRPIGRVGAAASHGAFQPGASARATSKTGRRRQSRSARRRMPMARGPMRCWDWESR